MGFEKTAEGRVFFKNANNDDAPATQNIMKDNVLPKDSTQVQMLMLLKSLNMKLKDRKTDHEVLKKDLVAYKKTIATLEEKSKKQTDDYIDLEQKVARKQNESNKKTIRVEDRLGETLSQLKEAKALVKKLEERDKEQDDALLLIKKDIAKKVEAEKALAKKQGVLEAKVETKTKEIDETVRSVQEKIDASTKRDHAILKRQKTLDTVQKEQAEKMVGQVAAYVDLTKRVNESEVQNQALENRLEDNKAQYLKLDRKIDKALEDRNRILKKVDLIEQAVLETRDALNAKAMVLLTDRGAVAGVDMPRLGDQALQTNPIELERRLQEEAMMPWWRRPFRFDVTTVALISVALLSLGWGIGQRNTHVPAGNDAGESVTSRRAAPRAGLSVTQSPPVAQDNDVLDSVAVYGADDYARAYSADADESIASETDGRLQDIVPAAGQRAQEVIDLNDQAAISDAFDNNQDALAAQLNAIEPGNVEKDVVAVADPAPAPARKVVAPASEPVRSTPSYNPVSQDALRPDPNLTDVAKKIEAQAFQGIPEAQHDMGAIYVAGHGQVKKDVDRAVFWFDQAANNGVANAQYNLGVLYHQGIGVDRNVERAMALYERAAKLGHPEAQYNLGIAYIEGIGVPYDPHRAAEFFGQAAQKGITEAAYNLGLIYENGLLGGATPDKALLWYKRAADQGSPEAKSALEQLASSLGIGVEDINRVVEKTSQAERGAVQDASAAQAIISGIQTELARYGLYTGGIDGVMGPMTQTAIVNFQKSEGLAANGVPSQELLTYMRSISEYR